MPRRTLRSATPWLVAIAAAIAAGAAVPACIAGGPPIDPITNEGGSDEGDAGPPDALPDAPVTEPHAVVGATPSHGPFTGGNRVVITGNGFASNVRIWFGDVEATDVVPVDATRVQATAPPGQRGAVAITAQNGDDDSTRRTLEGGYAYDALYADPSSGPISGGTEVRIVGQGTSWDEGSEAFIDDEACAAIEIIGPTEIVCTAPQGTPGAKSVRVEDGDETIVVLDAYTYEDSSNGYKGGLSGDPLDGSLRVLVYDNFSGDPVPGAYVVVGTDLATGIVEQADEGGVVVIEDGSLDAPVTVSVGAVCHSPISFVDVPVDTVTVYLDPILIPACAEGGDPPGVGGHGGATGLVEGEIVFPADSEFERGPFLVPHPIGNETVTAYLFAANANPLATFQLPPLSAAITENNDGTIGYGFAASSGPGNRTYYALAGLEDRTKNPPTFVAYSMGVVRGVPVFGGETTSEVYIAMEPLDLALTIEADPPAPGSAGPDRLLTTVAVRLGADGFAILPSGQKTPLLPLSGDVTFVGLPLLANGFEGSTYYVSSRAVTGPSFVAPMSVIGSVQTTTTAFPITMGGFVGLPTLETPELNASWDGRHLETTFSAGAPVDLTVYDIVSDNGLVHWTIAVPGGARAVELPDLRALEGTGLPSGSVSVAVYGARIDDFDYAALRNRHLRPFGMSAYSLDYVLAHLP
ncbi:MAG: IPT/TIG domain-containing protein [Polyangiaceae bacterium]|nr:IPT/TIG domain-containing protein [Polyangiaceae bacterium]